MSDFSDKIAKANSDAEIEFLTKQQMQGKYDPFSYGGSRGAYEAAIYGYRERQDRAAGQDRIRPDGTNYMEDRGLADQSAMQQAQGMGFYRGLANGTVPSAMRSTFQQGMREAVANPYSMAAGARGGAYGVAAARRTANQQAALQRMRGSSIYDALGAQEQNQAMAGYMNAANTARQHNQMGQGLSAQWAQDNLGAGMTQQGQDLQDSQFYAGLAHQTNLAQQSGATKGMLAELGQAEYARQRQLQDQQRQANATAQLANAGAQIAGDVARNWTGSEDDDNTYRKLDSSYHQKGDW